MIHHEYHADYATHNPCCVGVAKNGFLLQEKTRSHQRKAVGIPSEVPSEIAA